MHPLQRSGRAGCQGIACRGCATRRTKRAVLDVNDGAEGEIVVPHQSSKFQDPGRTHGATVRVAAAGMPRGAPREERGHNLTTNDTKKHKENTCGPSCHWRRKRLYGVTPSCQKRNDHMSVPSS